MTTRKIGRNGCDMARGGLLYAAETLAELIGDEGSGGPRVGNWDELKPEDRAKKLAAALKDIAQAQAILSEALAGQLGV